MQNIFVAVHVGVKSRTITDHLQRLFVLFCFRGSPNERQLLANGRGGGLEVAFSFGLFGRFPDFLPLGQQYLPLNRKPRIWLPVVDYPRARGRVADAGLNARGLWERDWETGREATSTQSPLLFASAIFFAPFPTIWTPGTGYTCAVTKGALSICIEKPVALVGQQMEQSFLQEMFRKKGIASDVVLFSHCYRNERNITEPFASSHSRTMLLGEMRGSFPQYCQWKEPFHLNCFFPYVPFHLAETEFPPVFRLILGVRTCYLLPTHPDNYCTVPWPVNRLFVKTKTKIIKTLNQAQFYVLI